MTEKRPTDYCPPINPSKPVGCEDIEVRACMTEKIRNDGEVWYRASLFAVILRLSVEDEIL